MGKLVICFAISVNYVKEVFVTSLEEHIFVFEGSKQSINTYTLHVTFLVACSLDLSLPLGLKKEQLDWIR
jgi:hypothetical protein